MRGEGSKNSGVQYDQLAKETLFLVSCTTSLDHGTLARISREKRENGEPELPNETNSQKLFRELETGGAKFGCEVGDFLTGWNGINEKNPLPNYVTKPLVSDFDLRLKEGMGDKWLEHYRHYAELTRFGVLIVAGTVDFFHLWANSKACREEVSKMPNGRLFAYIGGYITRVNVGSGGAHPTVRDGHGHVLFGSGDIYDGPLVGGDQHGPRGVFYYADGDRYEGPWERGE